MQTPNRTKVMEIPHDAFMSLALAFLAVVGGIVVVVVVGIGIADIIPPKKRK